ncbi:phage scaffolding protein [Enterococcus diestrammenae]|uniref:Capsid protein n=1 Tax=Enterococcus diestrammenae TaxID=1155073 RepID=A0ABV0F2H1_9ENTE|nr:phage scaffolding protein [Enterococcus diestrammenae]KAF1297626.1 hypothetical protein BAU18_13150 [Enterococcus diestrammenae]
MKKEDLIALGVEEETAKSIMALHGKTVTQLNAQVATLEGERDTAKQQLESNQAELDTLKESAKGNEALTTQLAELQAKFDDAKTNSQNTIATLKKESAIDVALLKAGAKNSKAAKALLDAEKIELAEDGTIKGLDEQLETIRAENDFLFQPAEPQEQGKPRIVNPGNPKGAQTTAVTKEQFDGMTYQERADLAANNPEAFKQITEGGQ